MKAIDYFNKYRLQVYKKDKLNELIQEMNEEVYQMAEHRGSKSDAAIISAIKEMNQKWNKLCNIYKEEYKMEVLIRNGYIKYWEQFVPELRRQN